MKIVNTYKTDLSKEFNYLDLSKKDFIFNDYKTSSKYGTQVIKISDDLWKSLLKYFKHHHSVSFKKDEPQVKEEANFLVYLDKRPLDKVNSITRILNKIFDKAIGSSMLRHIFLTDKYGETLDAQKKDALDMAHSKGMQQDYIKKPKAIVVNL